MALSGTEHLDPVHRPEDWERLYQQADAEHLPWALDSLDPDFAEALDRIRLTGRILDVGTGCGSQATALARRGFKVTGTDISPAAVAKARSRAEREGADVELLHDDVLDTRVTGPFDGVIDRGCFHVIAPESRPAYVRSVRSLLEPAGWLLLKVFSFMEDGTAGPYRFARAEICQAFEPTFEVVAIADAEFQGPNDPQPKALFCVLRRAR